MVMSPVNPNICPKCGGELGWTLRGAMSGNPYEGNTASCADCDYSYKPTQEWLDKNK